MNKALKQGLKRFLILSSLVLAIAVIFTFANDRPTFADSGFSTSHSSGGSSHSSGRSSSSSSSSRRSSSSSSSKSSSRSSSSKTSSIGNALAGLVKFIFFLAILCISKLCKLFARPKATLNVPYTPQNYIPNQYNIENQIKQYIPEFNRTQFLNTGYKIYCDIQEAWMNFELEKVKDVLTDELYNMYESQLATLEVKNEQNIMKGFVLNKCYLTGVQNQNNTITINTQYVIEFYDYIADRNTGKTIRGDSRRKMRVTYEMKFRQSLDPSKKVTNCPSCGAPLKINSFGTCEYCNAKVVTENTKWALTEKKALYQDYI